MGSGDDDGFILVPDACLINVWPASGGAAEAIASCVWAE
jgi:hypothetical protein